MEHAAKVRTCFWFEKKGHEAAKEYVALVPDSRIEAVRENGQPDDPMIVEFTLAGAPMMILTAGLGFELTPAASISILTEDQEETDRLWNALIANGGEPGRCGWVVDRFGVSWQVVPKRMPDLLASDDPAVVGRVSETMMQMGKIDIAALEKAAKEPAHE
ncbi:Glyoxalase superfamily enzyme, possibly 3-demethylubiquinone-9 3-methyltransferase [Cognatiyoonia koreensis]|uniref:Glyoxalase superfamily enzyme, possibly 3-demethylubiquinone-9 3-methyltransferase n=1 Tax=Cognatiyoonia koreensis TaxID=364200 RepID=A0A1I0NAN9_9RHOB|nr:VOC family protein [Cognatiyoonia koreensis]SEV97979.1 Glyoxalase superfamily enzyme, possibly 3-demethylubiquinone-9 3-methyltransferase [Cognatiyoonia koreensis]